MVQFATSFTGRETALSLAEIGSGIVPVGVSLISTEASAIFGIGSSQTVNVFGTVASGVHAIEISGGFSTRIAIGRGGSLLAHDSAIAVVGDATRIVNHGDIQSAIGDGINLTLTSEGGATAGGSVTNPFGYNVRNYGTITGDAAVRATDAAVVLGNWGTLAALGSTAISTGAFADSVRNLGTIGGDLLLGNGANTLVNRGEIDGQVITGINFGKDLIDNRGGTISGLINTGADADLIDNRSGTISGAVTTGFGDDIVDNRGGAITGLVQLGAGQDVYRPGLGNENVNAGAGFDTLDFSGSGALGLSINGSFAPTGAAQGDVFKGFETIIGSQKGDDRIHGGDGDETISGLGGDDVLRGGLGADTVFGGLGHDALYGDAGKDSLFGEEGNDLILGGDGDDSLIGGDGNDVLIGGAGNDALLGGLGADIYKWEAGAAKTKSPEQDVINGFSRPEGDKIDLSSIDANLSKLGDQPFNFIATADFSGKAGELRYSAPTTANPFVIVSGDVDGNGKADFIFTLNGPESFSGELFSSDFIL